MTFEAALATLAGGPRFSALFVPDNHSRVRLIAPHLAAAGFRSSYAARPPAERKTRGGSPVADIAVQLVGTGAWYHRALLSQGGARYLEGAIFPTGHFAESDVPEAIRFATRALSAGHDFPGSFEAYAYDSYLLLGRIAADAAGRADVRRRLAGLSRPAGVTSTTGFGTDRNPAGDPFMAVINERGFKAAP